MQCMINNYNYNNLESGWNLWLLLVGVVSRRWVWLVVRRYIDILTMIINFPYSTCIISFFGSSIPTSLFIFKMFFRSSFFFLQYIANVTQRIFEILRIDDKVEKAGRGRQEEQ